MKKIAFSSLRRRFDFGLYENRKGEYVHIMTFSVYSTSFTNACKKADKIQLEFNAVGNDFVVSSVIVPVLRLHQDSTPILVFPPY